MLNAQGVQQGRGDVLFPRGHQDGVAGGLKFPKDVLEQMNVRWVRDVYQRFSKKEPTQKKMVALQKVFVVILGVIAFSSP